MNIFLRQTGTGLGTVRFYESVYQPESTASQDSIQLSQIFLLAIVWNAVKTAKIKGEIKRSTDPLQGSCIPDQKFCRDPGSAGFLSGELDRARSEIHASHVPTRVGKREDVGAGAAANVDGAAGFVVLDEVKEFRWADACIPGRLPKIPVMKKEAAKQVLHFA
jgi:hypothetical protein